MLIIFLIYYAEFCECVVSVLVLVERVSSLP
jgi:hypothetical protein